VSQQGENVLRSYERKVLCKIFGTALEYQCLGGGAHKKPEISNTYIYDECDAVFINVVDVRWVGLVMRMEESDPAKKIFCTKTGGNGDRGRGRQKLRWFDKIEENVRQKFEN
jgi:hypothetical protein